jgi:hypothetical protein
MLAAAEPLEMAQRVAQAGHSMLCLQNIQQALALVIS